MYPQKFPRYEGWNPQIPTWCISHRQGGCIHRFFDTCPISPSGRYVAVFRLGNEARVNLPGETGEVVLIDLVSGHESIVARTCGWEPQLGANINWGRSDHELFFNDVDTSSWQPQLVRMDPLRGVCDKVEGGVYHVSPNGRWGAACSLEKMVRTQLGYGVLVPRERVGRNIGAPDDDGLFVTDMETGRRTLVLSLAKAVTYIPDLDGQNLSDWEIYGFHAKWSPQSDRLIFTIRRFPRAGVHRFDLLSANDPSQMISYDVLTLKPDGTQVCNAVPANCWAHGGHHINWFPDGKKLSMNLGGFADSLRLVQVNFDGSDLQPMDNQIIGSGHPTVCPGNRFVMTDAYAGESLAYGDGTVPLRWIDTHTRHEENLVRIGAATEPQPHGVLRVDPHPAWDRQWRYLVFNGVASGDNTRCVFMADMQSILRRDQVFSSHIG